jgi:hypothetical protein
MLDTIMISFRNVFIAGFRFLNDQRKIRSGLLFRRLL